MGDLIGILATPFYAIIDLVLDSPLAALIAASVLTLLIVTMV